MLSQQDAGARSWRRILNAYRDIRLLYVFLLGCSSGFPWVLTSSAMSGWLADAGLTRTAIGFFGSITAVYTLNFLWAPLLDRAHIPFLSARFGDRRGWILLMQGVMCVCTLAIAFTNPVQSLLWTSLLAFSITALSATQDVAVDAYRIDIIGSDQEKIPGASAAAVVGWWTGYSLPGYIAFTYADRLGWANVYFVLAGIMLMMMVFTLVTREPNTGRAQLQAEIHESYLQGMAPNASVWEKWQRHLAFNVIEPFAEFFRRNGWQLALTLLLFIFIFKQGEAILGRMSIQFYREIGYSNEQIAHYSKLIGWGFTIVFTLAGSLINTRFGVMRGLVIGGIAMAASNLIFSWIALSGPKESLFLFAVVVDNFTTAFSSVAFVSFLSWLTGKAFSATQYALLASVGNFGRTSLTSVSGLMIDGLGGNWAIFFVITSLMVIPGLLLLIPIHRMLKQQARNATGNYQP